MIDAPSTLPAPAVNVRCVPDVSCASGFSRNLFWDIDPAMLDLERHRKFVITRVLEYGTLEDWRLLCRRYSLEGVIQVAQKLRNLDAKAVSFLSAVGDVPRKSFQCCTSKQSDPKSWIS